MLLQFWSVVWLLHHLFSQQKLQKLIYVLLNRYLLVVLQKKIFNFMNKLFLQTINHNLQPLELWEEGVIGVYNASIFGPFYRKLVETSMQTLTREPLNILNTLGQPTFCIIERLPFSFWLQIVHRLYPCHLSRYHKQMTTSYSRI